MKTEFPLLSKSPNLFFIRTQTMLASSVISKPSFTKPLCLRRPFPSSQNRLFRIRFSSSVTASFSDLRQVNPIIPQTIQKNKLLVGRFDKFPLFFFHGICFLLFGKENETRYIGPQPKRDRMADWVSNNDESVRALPIYVGGFSLLAVLLNRTISGVAPVADASR